MKKRRKRFTFWMSIFLIFALVGTSVDVYAIGNAAEYIGTEADTIMEVEKEEARRDASSPAIVNETVVTERVKELAKLLEINNGSLEEGEGLIFTANGQHCGSDCTNNKCANCLNNNVLTSAWFQSKFGYTLDVALVPGQYGTGVPYSDLYSSAYTCIGFANFALWYIAKDCATSNVYRDMLGTKGQAFSKENLQNTGVRIGDIINVSPATTGNCHSVMFLEYVGDTGIKVLDCNWPSATGDATKKRSAKIHTLEYSAYEIMTVTRARNYQPTAVDNSSSSNPAIVNEVVVTERIKELAKLLEVNDGSLEPGEGLLFTANGQDCVGNSCENCKNANVITSSWFQNKFGYTVDVAKLPGHYGTGVPYNNLSSSAYTCVGFANFALWYIAKDNVNSDVYRDMIGTKGQAFTKANLQNSGVKIGDIINVSPSAGSSCHSVMFLEYVGTTGIKVLDCNWPSSTGNAARKKSVKIHTLNYSAYEIMTITRARNYQPTNDTTVPTVSNVQITQDSAGYTVSCTATDNVGIAKVVFPTWTEANGQDDLLNYWYDTAVGTKSGNTYSYRVTDMAHNMERGDYITHIYAYDYAGNFYCYTNVRVTLQNTYEPVKEIIYKNSKYQLYDDLLGWEDAEAFCEAKGGYLATITTSGEQDAVAALVGGRDSFRVGYYLGGTLNNKNLSWVTQEAVSYSKWMSGQPDNSGSGEPVLMIFANNTEWNDAVTWGQPIGYVCETEFPIAFATAGGNVQKGTTQNITLKASDSLLTTSDMSWKSSNTNVATVSNSGKVSFVNTGTVTITGSYGTKSASVTFTVVKSLASISLNKTDATMNRGDVLTLSVSYNPTDTTDNKKVTWSSSNTSVATVSAGKVTAVNAGTAVITAKVGNCTATCTVKVEDGSQVEAFVERMYTVALGREAEQGGLTYWSNALTDKTMDGASLAVAFIMSEEFSGKNYSDSQYIKVLYKTFFDREADSAGNTYWCNTLASGVSRASVLSGFVNSQEFFDICAEYGISRGVLRDDGSAINAGIYRFSERLYSTILERSGDKNGIEYWTRGIDSKTLTPENAAISFFWSDEYLAKNTSDEMYIRTLYRTFMDREADNGGLAYWKSALNGDDTRESVLRGFAGSPEFKEIMTEYGL